MDSDKNLSKYEKLAENYSKVNYTLLVISLQIHL